ncbi:MAG: hypothetical protein RJA22_1561 [Verrucomicrobiota bacterium]
MIRLRPDCLVFETATGESIPCPVQEVTLELLGESAQWVDSEIVNNAAAAVLHYFRVECGQENVSLPEFAAALEKVLRGMGFQVKTSAPPDAAPDGPGTPPAASTPPAPAPPSRTVLETDLCALAVETSSGGELFFLPRLRDEIRRRLDGNPCVLRFHNLRACVRHLTGAKRWNPRCRALEDRIVEYLRTCLGNERTAEGCALVVE